MTRPMNGSFKNVSSDECYFQLFQNFDIFKPNYNQFYVNVVIVTNSVQFWSNTVWYSQKKIKNCLKTKKKS